MATTLEPDLRRALAERIRYCHEMGIYDFYRRGPGVLIQESNAAIEETREEIPARRLAAATPLADSSLIEAPALKPEFGLADPAGGKRQSQANASVLWARVVAR